MKQYKITNGIYYGISVKITDKWMCVSPQRFYNYKAAIKAIKLIKTGVHVCDIDDNGVYCENFYEY